MHGGPPHGGPSASSGMTSGRPGHRGLGASDIRILVEAYLGGRVGFASNAERGTNFHVRLPLAGSRG